MKSRTSEVNGTEQIEYGELLRDSREERRSDTQLPRRWTREESELDLPGTKDIVFSTSSQERKNVYKQLLRQLIRAVDNMPDVFLVALKKYEVFAESAFNVVSERVAKIKAEEKDVRSGITKDYAKTFRKLCSSFHSLVVIDKLLDFQLSQFEHDKWGKIRSSNRPIYQATVKDLQILTARLIDQKLQSISTS